MTLKAREILRTLRGTVIYMYDTKTQSLIYLSESKEWLYQNIGIHHVSLTNCLTNGNLYLNRFFLIVLKLKVSVFILFLYNLNLL